MASVFSVTLHLILSMNPELVDSVSWPASSRDCPASALPPVLGLQAHAVISALPPMGTHSGPHALQHTLHPQITSPAHSHLLLFL